MREGSKVVCVDAEFPKEIVKFYTDLPKKDGVYNIRTIEVGVDLSGQAGEVAVTLTEIVNPVSKTPPHRERGFRQDRFREVEPPKVEAEELAEERTAVV